MSITRCVNKFRVGARNLALSCYNRAGFMTQRQREAAALRAAWFLTSRQHRNGATIAATLANKGNSKAFFTTDVLSEVAKKALPRNVRKNFKIIRNIPIFWKFKKESLPYLNDKNAKRMLNESLGFQMSGTTRDCIFMGSDSASTFAHEFRHLVDSLYTLRGKIFRVVLRFVDIEKIKKGNKLAQGPYLDTQHLISKHAVSRKFFLPTFRNDLRTFLKTQLEGKSATERERLLKILCHAMQGEVGAYRAGAKCQKIEEILARDGVNVQYGKSSRKETAASCDEIAAKVAGIIKKHSKVNERVAKLQEEAVKLIRTEFLGK